MATILDDRILILFPRNLFLTIHLSLQFVYIPFLWFFLFCSHSYSSVGPKGCRQIPLVHINWYSLFCFCRVTLDNSLCHGFYLAKISFLSPSMIVFFSFSPFDPRIPFQHLMTALLTSHLPRLQEREDCRVSWFLQARF